MFTLEAQTVVQRRFHSLIARAIGTKAMRLLAAVSTPLLIASGCASEPLVDMSDVPASLRAPSGQVLSLEALASGVQIYECKSKPEQPSTYEWTLVGPEAVLVDRSGRVIGKHYAGPTWESTDGSSVAGEVKARDPGPTPTAIPWLLMSAKATAGTGTFSAIKNVQRLRTVGGVAPAEPCTAANAKQVARVPYTATYTFYRNAVDARPVSSAYGSY